MRAIISFDVESGLSPFYAPAIAGLDYYSETRSAAAGVGLPGGDFVNLAPGEGEKLTISLGEVSGGGAEAGCLISGLRGTLSGIAQHARGRLSAAVQALNKTICEVTPDDLYATLFYASLDPFSRELRYVSAGHQAALLVRRSPARVRHLESTGAVLGLTRRTEYRQRTIWLEPGDLLVAFSDGITEATNAKGREFGECGVLEAATRHTGARAVSVARQILEAADRHTGGAPACDDRTVAVVRFQGVSGLGDERYEEVFAAA